MASEADTHAGHPADSTAGDEEPTPETATEAQSSADGQADTGVGQRTPLIEPERGESYNNRWKELKGEFVDDPRGAVQGANELIGEALDELEEAFRRRRSDLEQGLDSEQTTTVWGTSALASAPSCWNKPTGHASRRRAHSPMLLVPAPASSTSPYLPRGSVIDGHHVLSAALYDSSVVRATLG